MMPKPLTFTEPPATADRAFPWFCPRCRRKEVRRTTIPYQCQRNYNGRLITVVLANLAVPRCDNCGELVFDYEAEEQINRACESQASTLKEDENTDHLQHRLSIITHVEPPSTP